MIRQTLRGIDARGENASQEMVLDDGNGGGVDGASNFWWAAPEGPKDLMVRYHGFRIAAAHLSRLAFGGVCEA